MNHYFVCYCCSTSLKTTQGIRLFIVIHETVWTYHCFILAHCFFSRYLQKENFQKRQVERKRHSRLLFVFVFFCFDVFIAVAARGQLNFKWAREIFHKPVFQTYVELELHKYSESTFCTY